jgi:uncharacterized protein RhaS with RHS repeats
MMDPRIGKWLEDDPIDFSGGDSNLSRYGHNDPTNIEDRSGLKEEITTLKEPKFKIEDGREVQIRVFKDVLLAKSDADPWVQISAYTGFSADANAGIHWIQVAHRYRKKGDFSLDATRLKTLH